jgi:hypothetical protein
MSTNDVPGLKDTKTGKSKHNDELAMGCWAEHDDGSMIFVESSEDGRIVYSVFDLADVEVIEYRDSMSELGFKKAFSYVADADDDDDDGDDFATPWTWHDKTPFPWDRVIAMGGRDGGRPASAEHVLNAAEKVARSRNMHRRKFNYDSALAKAGSLGGRIVGKIQRAIGELGK